MALYVRESDILLADSTTIESAVKACREYGQKEGYLFDPNSHEYKEAISAYSVPYYQRPVLMNMLKAAGRKEFDVLVITEVRALSRKGAAEVLLIYNELQKVSIRLETISERIDDSPVGELLLTWKATYARLEREQSYLRLQRGKADRIAIGKAPNGSAKASYGYLFIDTQREVKGAYIFNDTIIYVDSEGNEWSEHRVCLYIFDLLKQMVSLNAIARKLNEIGIPPPKKAVKGEPHWQASTVRRIASNPIYAGEVWANRWKRVGKKTVLRPKEEWIHLPAGTAPAMIETATFEQIQEQLVINKQDSIRNNQHRGQGEIGLLRAGHVFCGICGRRMHIDYPSPAAARNGETPVYLCKQRSTNSEVHNHLTLIHMPFLDAAAWEKVIQVLHHPDIVREHITDLREENKRPVDPASVIQTIESIKKSLRNLYMLAEHAPDDEELADITERMQELGRQKRIAEGMLDDLADDEEERMELEGEIARFEKWVEDVKPFLTDSSYIPSYEEKRAAVRILGIRATVFPTNGNHPFRHKIDFTVPKIMEKMQKLMGNSMSNQTLLASQTGPSARTINCRLFSCSGPNEKRSQIPPPKSAPPSVA